MKLILALLLSLYLLLVAFPASALELSIAFASDRPPYCFRKDNLDQGIEIELLRLIMAQAGHTIKIVTIPKIRLIKAVRDKEVDAAATVQDNKDSNLYFSDPYLEFQNVAISKSLHKIQLNNLPDLKNYSFIIWQDGWRNLGPEFEATYRPDANGIFPKNYNQAFNQLSQNKMFWADRVQIIIIDKTIFEHNKRQLATEFDTSVALTYHDVIKTKTPYSVAFNDANLRQQFNEGLKRIRTSATYQKIIDSYK
ncbi:substrate-binding periplasmic protein [Undibacterium flavidum]|uniref:Transporter substrate-binding domain-containing protein n=1 Tax=Undibacterium flavidum TaxID=2762297 RepID=A0ABR6Y6U9_9BURK|nr:transporter substrate-binding domain-containing protein [Undibacterium flavidum]MBC3872339.1 transporter substrate-binding domain-containing protein [Undibacterium flavidum]